MEVKFDDVNQLTINDKVYYVPKMILNKLEYFEIVHNGRFRDSKQNITLESTIDFNIILNIISYDLHGISYDINGKHNVDEFIEIIQILIYFGAKNNIVSRLILKYNEINLLPFDKLEDIIFEKNDTDILKEAIIKELKKYIHSKPKIEMPHHFADYIKSFKIHLNNNDINEILKSIKIKLAREWYCMLYGKVQYGGLYTRAYNMIYKIIDDNGDLVINKVLNTSLITIEMHLRELLERVGISETLSITHKKINKSYNIEIEINNQITILYNVLVIPFFDIIAKYKLDQMFVNIQNQKVDIIQVTV